MRQSEHRVAVIWDGLQRQEAVPDDGRVCDRRCYMLSLRDQKHLRPSVELKQVLVSNYADVARTPWRNVKDLNYDDGLTWLKESRDLFADLFCIGGTGATEFWFCKFGTVSSALKARVAELPPPLSTDVHRPDLQRSQQTAQVFRLRSKDEFVSLLWPDLVHELYNSLFIATEAQGSSPTDNALTSRMADLMKPSSAEGFCTACINTPPAWKYVVRMDLSLYDIGDPLYCLTYAQQERWEQQITDTLSRNGYQIHRVPMLDPLIWNWAGLGDIPVTTPLPF